MLKVCLILGSLGKLSFRFPGRRLLFFFRAMSLRLPFGAENEDSG